MMILGPKKKDAAAIIMRRMKGGAESDEMAESNAETQEAMEEHKTDNKSEPQVLASKIMEAVKTGDTEKLAECIKRIMESKS